jgi:serine/threonine protein kinase
VSSRVVGPYAIQALLGSGGIGHVYAAVDQDLGRRVALKALRPEFSDDSDLLERFRNEATNLARLNHPNITTLYSLYRDTNPQQKRVFMVMEMVSGETLEAILARAGRLSPRGCLAVMAQAIAGLSYAHSVGIIHRDIKPSNMMLNDAGLLKITDFGIARVQGSQRLTRHGAVVGTLNYIAPEQIKGRESDERSDLYSLACVLYELLSARKPFIGVTEYELIRAQLEVEAEPLTVSIPDLDPSIGDAVMRALAKNPDDRFASVAEFAEALGTASVQESAVSIVKEQVLANLPSVEPSAQEEPLFVDTQEPVAHLPHAPPAFPGLTEQQTRGAPARPRKRHGAMAAATAVVVVMLTGGVYLAHKSHPGSIPVAIQSPSEPLGGPNVTQGGGLKPQHEQAVIQPGASGPPGRPAVTPDALRLPPKQGAVTQAMPTRPPNLPAALQDALGQPPGLSGGTPSDRSAPGDASGQAQNPAAPQSVPLQAVAPSGDAISELSSQQPAQDEPLAIGATTSKTLAGLVSSYSDDGWPIIDGITVRLNGVGPLAPGEAKPVSDWIATHGNYLACTASQPSGYRCLTRQDFDLAQAILLNGAARTSTDAAPAYRDAEAHARTAKRGVWR